MAALHLQLGHIEEASRILHEAVSVAQQRQDDVCVAFCLSVLAQLEAAACNPNVVALLEACRDRAGLSRAWRLQALTSMELVDTQRPAHVR